MTYYTLWRLQKDGLGRYNFVTTQEQKKNYPSSNLYVVDQFNSLKELRNFEDLVTECKQCGKQMSEETRKIYTDTIPPTYRECKKKDEVIKQL